uniref:Uncharacterized protein n=1 Tax=Hucho hucho TaxID=62062 RepID=A0A4W5QY38_9TELE
HEIQIKINLNYRLLLSVSFLMLLTQRVTSVSMDLQDLQADYALNFTALLGRPLSSFDQFVYFVEQITISPPPHPFLWHLTTRLNSSQGIPYLANEKVIKVVFNIIAVVLRIRYYSHWRISLNNAAGLEFRGVAREDSTNWSGLSDGDIWTTEMSFQVSEFACRWNATTATSLRRLGSEYFPKALYKYLKPKLTSTRRILVCTYLGWVNTQMVTACVVIAVELRSTSSLRMLGRTYTGFFPLLNVLFIFSL